MSALALLSAVFAFCVASFFASSIPVSYSAVVTYVLDTVDVISSAVCLIADCISVVVEYFFSFASVSAFALLSAVFAFCVASFFAFSIPVSYSAVVTYVLDTVDVILSAASLIADCISVVVE